LEGKLLVFATHGFEPAFDQPFTLPALLSSEGDDYSLFNTTSLFKYNFDGSIVLLSACDTAAGFVDRPDRMFTGFVKSFGDLGANLITASLWPVNSVASKQFTLGFVDGLAGGNIVDAMISAKDSVQVDNFALPFVFIYP